MQHVQVSQRCHVRGSSSSGSSSSRSSKPWTHSTTASSHSRRIRCLCPAQGSSTLRQAQQQHASPAAAASSDGHLQPPLTPCVEAAPLPSQAAAPSSGTPIGSSTSSTSSTRRQALAGGAAALASLVATGSGRPLQLAAQAEEGEPDLSVTDRIYLDFGVASSAFKPAGERTLGDKTVLPTDAEPAGRVVIGLYGRVAPVTVANLVSAVRAGAFTGTALSKISPGEFVQLGRQGNRRLGDVEAPPGLQVNSDLAAPAPFKLSHARPGTVSLSLADNDEDPGVRQRPNYRGLEFLITTGPGPVPRLDGLNPVFGRVESGMDVVARLAQVPSFQPDIRSQQLNRFAAFIGDERADSVRRQYGRPLKAVIVLDSGVLSSAADAAAAQQGSLALAAGSTLELP